MSIRSIRGLFLFITLLVLLIATTGQRRPYTPPREPATPPARTLMPQQPQPPQMPRTSPSSATPVQRPPAVPISPVTELPDSIPVTPPTILTKEKLTFPQRPGVPANIPQTKTICGDPKMPGPYALRIKIPSGIIPLPHVHPDTRMSVVLEGVYCFGYGEEIDEENVFELQPGSFFTEPSNIPHYGWAKPGTTVVIQSTGYGPTATAIVPRKDNSPPDKKR